MATRRRLSGERGRVHCRPVGLEKGVKPAALVERHLEPPYVEQLEVGGEGVNTPQVSQVGLLGALHVRLLLADLGRDSA